jgi:hypothetical protein
MAVTAFHDFPLAPRDRKWDGAAAEKRVRALAGAEDEPNGKAWPTPLVSATGLRASGTSPGYRRCLPLLLS